MALKNLIVYIAACLLFSATTSSALQTVNGRIKITIGTTSGCGDTVSFINNQLGETYRQYREFLDIEFVPWGRTVRNANGSFTCQFGVNDCWANRLHRCALNLLRGNQDAQVHYIQCEFSSPFPSFIQGTYLCAQGVGLNLIDVDNCVANPGDLLDSAAEEAARVPMQIINFVPSISFNDQSDLEVHNQARQRLASMICFALADDPTSGVTGCQI